MNWKSDLRLMRTSVQDIHVYTCARVREFRRGGHELIVMSNIIRSHAYLNLP